MVSRSYTLGLGAEVRVHENWSLFAEYTHTDFGNLDAFEGNATLVLDQVKLGVNLRF
jgi:opacity protein-like surface antigen